MLVNQNSIKQNRSDVFKTLSKELGFDFCGISASGFLESEAPRLEKWLNAQMHGQMQYMSNYFDKRLDTTLLVEGSKSVVSLMFNYFPEHQIETTHKVSKYAYGEDYHDVLKNKLRTLVARTQEILGEYDFRIFVDSAPVLEKAWAVKSGLGWQGKNGNIIAKKNGSFFFLAEIICDLEMIYDHPTTNHCGNCTKCIDECPTEAITEPYVIDGSKCISYLTIELKENIPTEFKNQLNNWAYGCDICQDVCPWNRFSKAHKEEAFAPLPELEYMFSEDIEHITEETFKKVFKKSAIKRTKFSGFVRNRKFLS